MVNAIEVQGLVKSYSGQAVLRDLTFAVPTGSICGFLGTNGAGKTTTLRILMSFARADAGRAYLLGLEAGNTARTDTLAINQRVGFVPEIKEPFPFARVHEALRLTRGFYPAWDKALEQRLIDEFQIPSRQWCSKLSKGTAAKLSLLLALCRRAELLILDEPTEGLDPVAQEQAMRVIVEQVSERGATVLFSTHHLHEVEQIADRVVLLGQGRCRLDGPLDEIKERNRRVRCVMEREEGALPLEVAHFQRDGRMLSGFSTEDPGALGSVLAPAGIRVIEVEPATLKEVFFAQSGSRRSVEGGNR